MLQQRYGKGHKFKYSLARHRSILEELKNRWEQRLDESDVYDAEMGIIDEEEAEYVPRAGLIMLFVRAKLHWKSVPRCRDGECGDGDDEKDGGDEEADEGPKEKKRRVTDSTEDTAGGSGGNAPSESQCVITPAPFDAIAINF
jgi:hypothetical protein